MAMKSIIMLFALMFACSNSYVIAQDVEAKEEAKPKAALKQPGMLSEEEIGKFVKEYTDEKSGKTYSLKVSFFANKQLTSQQKKNLEKPGAKLPYKVYGYLYEGPKGGKLTRVDKGTFEFYVIDENGKMVQAKKSVAYVKLCSS